MQEIGIRANIRDNIGETDISITEDIGEPKKLGQGAFATTYSIKIGDTIYVVKIHSKKYGPYGNHELAMYRLIDNNINGICKCYGGFTCKDGSVYIMLEYLSGCDLSDYINNHQGGSPTEVVAKVSINIAKILQDLHRISGIAHLDLKPGNIKINLVTLDATIFDLGLATKMRENLRAPKGTIPYMAKEIFESETNVIYITPKMDVWALGVIMWELTTYYTPFEFDMDPKKKQAEQVINNIVRYKYNPNDYGNTDKDQKMLDLIRSHVFVPYEDRMDLDLLIDELNNIVG